jgi:hypothetical protein
LWRRRSGRRCGRARCARGERHPREKALNHAWESNPRIRLCRSASRRRLA